jgi:molecular chaperone GrpE
MLASQPFLPPFLPRILTTAQDKYLRSVADYRNLQERTKREIQAAKDFALQRFARDLVESVDNLDRALTTVDPSKLTSENPDLVTLHDGLKMTDGILISTLKKHGLERFDPSTENEKFNPNVHEAVFQTPMPDKEDGVCFHTQQKGFLLNGRVLRAAKVGVVKNS